MLFGSCAPPSSAPELGRAFWGQLLPSHHRAGPRAHPRGRIQQGSPVGVPCLLVPWGLGLFPPRVPAAASCLQQPQVVGFKPGAIPLRASTPQMTKIQQNPKSIPKQALPWAPTSRTAIYMGNLHDSLCWPLNKLKTGQIPVGTGTGPGCAPRDADTRPLAAPWACPSSPQEMEANKGLGASRGCRGVCEVPLLLLGCWLLL